MKVFFGAAIQAVTERGGRSERHGTFIEAIKDAGFDVWTEHTKEPSLEATVDALTKRYGDIPKDPQERRRFVRDKMIEGVEGDIKAAIFEVSVPSLGTGIELTHAYLRPRLGLPAIPVLALYEKDYWVNHLSTMVRGLSKETAPHFQWKEYTTQEDGVAIIQEFLSSFA